MRRRQAPAADVTVAGARSAAIARQFPAAFSRPLPHDRVLGIGPQAHRAPIAGTGVDTGAGHAVGEAALPEAAAREPAIPQAPVLRLVLASAAVLGAGRGEAGLLLAPATEPPVGVSGPTVALV
jgi:hypothetical protein